HDRWEAPRRAAVPMARRACHRSAAGRTRCRATGSRRAFARRHWSCLWRTRRGCARPCGRTGSTPASGRARARIPPTAGRRASREASCRALQLRGVGIRRRNGELPFGAGLARTPHGELAADHLRALAHAMQAEVPLAPAGTQHLGRDAPAVVAYAQAKLALAV